MTNYTMKPDQTIAALLQVFKSTPTLFPAKTLKDLDLTLADLEDENIHIRNKKLKEWVGKQTRQIKENVNLFSQSFRELKSARKDEASEEEILQNRFQELREAVKIKLKPQ